MREDNPTEANAEEEPAPETRHRVGGAEPVIVIGSGFGGAAVACRLAQAGFDVLIIERGRRYQQGDFPNVPSATALLPDMRRWSWDLDQGLWDVIDLEEIVSVQAAGYGGGSLVYANVHIRPPARVFDSGWPSDVDRPRLDRYYDLAASMLEVEPVTAHPGFHRDISKSGGMAVAAKSLKREVFHPPLAIRYPGAPDKNDHGVNQSSCTGCGACCTGCPQGAKNTLDHNYLAVAEQFGAKVLTQCEVIGLVQQTTGEWVVRCFDHLEASRRNFSARHVFLCAGAVHSTRLMAGAQLLRKNRRVKRRVGTGYFPGGDAIGIVYDTERPQRPSVGPVISTALVEYSPTDASSFFMLQDGGYADCFDRTAGLLRGSMWLGGNKLSDPVKPNGRRRREQPGRLGQPTVPLVEGRVPSMFDELLTAFVARRFQRVPPGDLRGIKRQLAERASLPLITSTIVGETIRHGFLSRHPILGKPFLPLARLGAWAGLGSNKSLGIDALLALLSTGRLAPKALAATIFGYDAGKSQHRAVLLAMGRDAALGTLHYRQEEKRLVADLNLVQLTPGYTQQERLMTDVAKALGGELRTNPVWEYLRKPITVHNQGGCRMSRDETTGVTDSFGRVHGCPGLHILDGSILCASVGVNPSATILALAERGVLDFIHKEGSKPDWPRSDDPSAGARSYAEQVQRAATWRARASKNRWDLEPPPPRQNIVAPIAGGAPMTGLKLEFTERLKGFCSTPVQLPRDETDFLDLEVKGRPKNWMDLTLHLHTPNLAAFLEDPEHPLELGGSGSFHLPDGSTAKDVAVKGRVNLFVAPAKDYAIAPHDRDRLRAQKAADGDRYASVSPRDERSRERRMYYELQFDKTDWVLHGYKRIASTRSWEAWRQTSILYVGLTRVGGAAQQGAFLEAAGSVHAELTSFLFEQIPSIKVTGTNDEFRKAWAIAEFGSFFFGTLQRIYLPSLGAAARKSSRRRRSVQDRP
jgi:choline dehydrogenase-like flavoprotein